MDEIDTKLLTLLSENSDMSATSMVPLLNLSIPAINKRIARLRQNGIIRRFTVNIAPEKIGKPVMAFLMVTLDENADVNSFMDFLYTDQDILECYAITGEYDFMIKLCAKTTQELKSKIFMMRSKNHVSRVESIISLQEHKFLPSALPDPYKKQTNK